MTGDSRLEKEVVHQVKLRQISWFDYALMIGLSIIFGVIFNLYNDNAIPLIYGWGEKNVIPEISLSQAQEDYKKNEAIFIDARKSAFFEQEHIKGAMNLPLVLYDLMFPMFQFTLEQTPGGKDKPLIVYGGSFSRRFDVELARLLKNKVGNKVMVLQRLLRLGAHLSPGREAAQRRRRHLAGSGGSARIAAAGHFSNHLNSSRPPQSLPVGGLPAASGGDLYRLCPEQNLAAGGLCLEHGGLRHDARLGGEPLGPRPALGRAGGRAVPGPGHPHPGRGHPDRGHGMWSSSSDWSMPFCTICRLTAAASVKWANRLTG